MRVLERVRFEEIMESDNNGGWEGDNACQGLDIIRKNCPNKGISGAEHGIIYSVSVKELLDGGLIEEEAKELRKLNWMIEDDYLACFV